MARRSNSIDRNEFAAYGGDVVVEPAAAPPPAPGNAGWTPANVAIALVVALFGGTLGVPAAFAEAWASGASSAGAAIILVVILGPAVEEMVKPLALIFLLERAPHRVLGRGQVWGSAALAGAAFAVIENLIYLNIYIPAQETAPGFDVATWRWTVCTALHVGCSSVMGIGLAREHVRSTRQHRQFEVERVLPYYCVAVAIHGAYNAYATFFLS